MTATGTPPNSAYCELWTRSQPPPPPTQKGWRPAKCTHTR